MHFLPTENANYTNCAKTVIALSRRAVSDAWSVYLAVLTAINPIRTIKPQERLRNHLATSHRLVETATVLKAGNVQFENTNRFNGLKTCSTSHARRYPTTVHLHRLHTLCTILLSVEVSLFAATQIVQVVASSTVELPWRLIRVGNDRITNNHLGR
jgi:hypothetical protein